KCTNAPDPARTDAEPADGTIMARRGSSRIDGARRPRREESTRRGTSKRAEGVGSVGSAIVCGFTRAGPRPQRAEDARTPRGIREELSDLGRRSGERPRRSALVRPDVRKEVVGD